MKRNEGAVDRVVRAVIGILLWTFGILLATGIAKYVFFFFGTTTILSALLGWCPLYIPFGVDTCHKNKKE